VVESCPEVLDEAYSVARSKRQEATMEAAAKHTDPIGQHGGARVKVATEVAKDHREPVRQPGEPIGGNGGQVATIENRQLAPAGSNAASYRIRRLRRDDPEVAQRLDQGEFRSVAAAERAAGGEDPHPTYPKKSLRRRGFKSPLDAELRSASEL
jgi:hypothetical protein